MNQMLEYKKNTHQNMDTNTSIASWRDIGERTQNINQMPEYKYNYKWKYEYKYKYSIKIQTAARSETFILSANRSDYSKEFLKLRNHEMRRLNLTKKMSKETLTKVSSECFNLSQPSHHIFSENWLLVLFWRVFNEIVTLKTWFD